MISFPEYFPVLKHDLVLFSNQLHILYCKLNIETNFFLKYFKDVYQWGGVFLGSMDILNN
jgi:hypothetical protein